MTVPPVHGSRLLASIAQLNSAHPHLRKRLLGVDVNHGRELLLALAQQTGGWVGWEATTLRSIADDLAFVALNDRELRSASDEELSALVAAAFETVSTRADVSSQFAAMTRHRGFRTALEDSILELRMAGVTPAELHAASQPGSPASQLVPVLAAYEAALREANVVDPAGVFGVALDAFDDNARYVLDGITALVPTLTTRGVAGELVRRLVRGGAVLLEIDRAIPRTDAEDDTPDTASLLSEQNDEFARSVLGWSLTTRVPASDDQKFDASLASVDLFAASTPSEELREVCRRVMAEGLRWDDVEIVTTDPDTYGIALDTLCQQLGIGATMLKGIPLIRTRIGRALERWFAWLENGLPADVLRQALEAGEIPVHATNIDAHDLALELRGQRVGWGRQRYVSLLERYATAHNAPPGDRDDDTPDAERAARQVATRQREIGLAEVLRAMLALTPAVPERGSHEPVTATTTTLAIATQLYIARIQLRDAAEEQTMDRLTRRLGRLAELEDDALDFASVIVGLRESLSDLRAWPPTGMARKPYRADGGMLHLTDLPHAGASGRTRTFVVGLDAERTSGSARQDPLLPDAVRRAVGLRRLPDTAARRSQSLERLGVSLSSLRGRVTLSWATRGADGRDAGPSPLVLQTHRVIVNDAAQTFAQLRAQCLPPACAVPVNGDGVRSLLDRRDVWLHAIGSGVTLLDATVAVRGAFAMLDAGLTAQAIAVSSQLSAFHGLVANAGAALDPTRSGAMQLSPSGLESLGKCPLQWFYRYGLGLRAPQDPEYDTEAWLDALQRGSLLHEVFEQFVREYRGLQPTILEPLALTAITSITRHAIERWRELVPPPSESVSESESAELHRAARAFLQMEREALQGGELAIWAEIEYGFGETSRATYTLADGREIALRGRADRIDTLADGTLRVVDYKTGKPGHYRSDGKHGAYNGGRLLQPALYAAAIGSQLERNVSRFEYRFPTDRGGNAIVAFDADALVEARGVVTSLVDHIRTGRFLPTTDADDCKHCDHAPICRVSTSDFAVDSPRADWASANAEFLPEFASMRQRRGADMTEGDA